MHQRKSIMSDEPKSLLVICLVIALLAFGTKEVTVLAQKVDKGLPIQQRTLALGEDEVKQLLLLMDTDKNGKISKKEFMDFMIAEFERLDKDKSGELDPKELTQSQVRASRSAVGK
jgi:Sec-independent protein translocase protein TatA